MVSEKIRKFKQFMSKHGFIPLGNKKQFEGGIGVSGHVKMWRRYRNGERVLVVDQPNLVVNIGLGAIAHMFSGQGNSPGSSNSYWPDEMGIGDGTSPVSSGDVKLTGTTEAWVNISGYTFGGLTEGFVRIAAEFDETINFGSTLVWEAGIKNTWDYSGGGALISRTKLTAGVQKTNQFALNVEWTFTFSVG